MFNDELILIKKIPKQDKNKNTIYDEEKITILCRKENVTRSEFYSSGRDGYKPSIVFVIHSFEYENQQEVVHENTRYRIIRTFTESFEEMELVCEVVIDES